MIYSILRSYAEQNEKIVISHKVDKIWKLYAECSSGAVSWLSCQKIAGLEYWVQLIFNFTPVNVLQV